MSPAKSSSFTPIHLLFLLTSNHLFPVSGANARAPAPLQTYIVHVSPPESAVGSLEEWHASLLPSSSGEGRLVHSYGHAFSGFAARLTEEEVEEMRGLDGFVHAQKDRLLQLHTTYSPTFLGLRQGDPGGLWNRSDYGKGVIIGMLDTGIWPSHPSFNDEGMPPPPRKWKGACEFNSSFQCNNKIIGARVFAEGWMATKGGTHNSTFLPTPFDEHGHGTHTASIAAGKSVENANELGQANGTASGMAPYAHLAIYKVCTSSECHESDLLAGIENAVKDGVDVVSISVGPRQQIPIYSDPIAIAAFGATAKGVFVSAAAGNSGPSTGTTVNGAPWMLTVGAGTTDRSIRATVKLGNGEEFKGESVYQPANFSSKLLPLVYPHDQMSEASYMAGNCSRDSLVDLDVKGKVVVCNYKLREDEDERGEAVKNAGGTAMILRLSDTIANAVVLPASTVAGDGGNITNYIANTPDPTSTILFNGTVFDSVAPSVTAFSSRGPTAASPGILKPDIIAPGLNILGAWHEPPSGRFKVLSGSSMSCPQLGGIAALLKSTHPDWSPAMIKSALMTTADITSSAGGRIADSNGKMPASFLAIGAGQVNPSRADDPGLVYDLPVDDYIGYLCGLDLADHNVGAIARRAVRCVETRKIDATQLNYPSIYVKLGTYSSVEATVVREVTNVGPANSTYEVKVEGPPGVEVEVKPVELRFEKVGEKRRYTVHLTRNETEWRDELTQRIGSGYLYHSWSTWDGTLTWVSKDGKYSVRIVVAASM